MASTHVVIWEMIIIITLYGPFREKKGTKKNIVVSSEP